MKKIIVLLALCAVALSLSANAQDEFSPKAKNIFIGKVVKKTHSLAENISENKELYGQLDTLSLPALTAEYRAIARVLSGRNKRFLFWKRGFQKRGEAMLADIKSAIERRGVKKYNLEEAAKEYHRNDSLMRELAVVKNDLRESINRENVLRGTIEDLKKEKNPALQKANQECAQLRSENAMLKKKLSENNEQTPGGGTSTPPKTTIKTKK